MAIRTVTALQIADASGSGEGRRAAAAAARSLGLSETDAGRAAVVATELGSNLIKHAGHGELIVNAGFDPPGRAGIELLALDRGPGIADIAAALRDGYSTAGSPGTGLGSVRRLADEFDIYSGAGRGTAVLARVRSKAGEDSPKAALRTGAISVAKPGEEVCGDAWEYFPRGRSGRLLVADGLGHGLDAAAAAIAAVESARREKSSEPAAVLDAIHKALRATRGAAVALADVDASRHRVRYAGVGNIAGAILSTGHPRSLVSHNGTVGAEMRRVREFEYPWPERAILVMHTDGLSERWDLEAYPGLMARSATLIAGVLYRDYRRERDDATVVVVKDGLPGGDE